MMKPKALTPHEEGLLEYLEDIIGSDRFVEAAEEAAKMVEVLKDKRAEKVGILDMNFLMYYVSYKGSTWVPAPMLRIA